MRSTQKSLARSWSSTGTTTLLTPVITTSPPRLVPVAHDPLLGRCSPQPALSRGRSGAVFRIYETSFGQDPPVPRSVALHGGSCAAAADDRGATRRLRARVASLRSRRAARLPDRGRALLAAQRRTRPRP